MTVAQIQRSHTVSKVTSVSQVRVKQVRSLYLQLQVATRPSVAVPKRPTTECSELNEDEFHFNFSFQINVSLGRGTI